MTGHFGLDTALQDQAEAAASILGAGGVVAVPTDTLYGLAACVFDRPAVRRVFGLKGRAHTAPLPVLLSEADQLTECAVDVPDLTWRLAEHFWPGALTLVLKRADGIPSEVSAGRDTIALRVPAHPVPRAIVSQLGAPITGTSANRTGRPALTTAEEVRREFGEELDMVVDNRDLPAGLASTVLDLSAGTPRIVREGAVPRSDLERVCGSRTTSV